MKRITFAEFLHGAASVAVGLTVVCLTLLLWAQIVNVETLTLNAQRAQACRSGNLAMCGGQK